MVEFMQEPNTEQTALQAAVPAQQARLLMLRIPPILMANELSRFHRFLSYFLCPKMTSLGNFIRSFCASLSSRALGATVSQRYFIKETLFRYAGSGKTFNNSKKLICSLRTHIWAARRVPAAVGQATASRCEPAAGTRQRAKSITVQSVNVSIGAANISIMLHVQPSVCNFSINNNASSSSNTEKI